MACFRRSSCVAGCIIIFPHRGNVRMRISKQLGDVHEIVIAKRMAVLPRLPSRYILESVSFYIGPMSVWFLQMAARKLRCLNS
jgi:hypothetical protein